ncbi:lactonase family protein [Lichenihabitans sp. PAMC28606]|uniref:lactonase family protein n=1 Tax=Lichenihabitans sp. PAMC28606 TaxID=2880932 RepID=UPI001D0BE31D|nr:lactonase family protein [Lichenihabitans sp. PAMC28606]UDL94153.1 lactonase family protein [Lichenihabitans sp. PAMC28606]
MSTSMMVVGSLNRDTPYFGTAAGVGLSVFRFDSAVGTAELLCEERGIDNPTYLSVKAATGCIYAGSEVFGWHEGTVTAFRFDAATNRLHYINKQPSLGSTTAHTGLDPDGHHVLAANYALAPAGEGPDRAVVIFPVRPDGGLGAPISSVRHVGQGPNAERQERSHAHCILPSPDGRFAIVADLGLDRLFSYRLSEGHLSEPAAASLALTPGSGPRHFLFHPNGDIALLVGELDSTLTSLRYEADTGTFQMIQTVPMLPPDFTGPSDAADLQLHPAGFVYASNRGHDSIVIHRLDADTGHLTPVGHHPCGGHIPRNIAIDPTGTFLLVANQKSDRISIFRIDAASGTLSDHGSLAHGTPMCIKFMV